MTSLYPIVTLAGIDALVNNAAIFKRAGDGELDAEEYRRLLNVNVVSPTALTKAALPKLRESKGAVVFISSIAG